MEKIADNTKSEQSPEQGNQWSAATEASKFNPIKAERTRKEIEREISRAEAEEQYQNELTKLDEIGEQEGITQYSIDFEGEKIDVHELAGADYKMLVSALGSVGQSLGNHPRGFDPETWENRSKDIDLSSSLVSNEKNILFDTRGLIVSLNNFQKGQLHSVAPIDQGIARDEGIMGQYKDHVMGPNELLEATGSGLTQWNEVAIDGHAEPDSIVVYGESRDDINEESKRAAQYFGVPIRLIRTDIYGQPLDRHSAPASPEAQKFWQDRAEPVTGRAKREKEALLKEVEDYYDSGTYGEMIQKYLGGFDDEFEAVRASGVSKDEFANALQKALGPKEMAALADRIKDGA